MHRLWRLTIPLRVMALLHLLASGEQGRAQDASTEIFTNLAVPRLQITIPAESLVELRSTPREYVKVLVSEGTNAWPDTAVHLKGSIGSFRGIDGKPSFTLVFDKFEPQQRFHGLRKIHLNNSVEDASYLNELIGSQLFRAANLPAPLVTHAIVELNGKPLGLYVLKEGFAEEFLARHFRHPDGNLYDIGPGHDVNETLTRSLGHGPDDEADLRALSAAALEPDTARRWQRLERTLARDDFISFMAMEILLGHRDGYCLARNNFRVYQDVDSNRMFFFPHGMDQLFGNPRAVVQPLMNGLVARAVLDIPEGRRAYRRRCSILLTNVLQLSAIDQTIDAAILRLRPLLAAEAAAAFQSNALALKQRVANRKREVEKQLTVPPLELLHFSNGTAVLTGWEPFDLPTGGGMTQTNTSDGKRALMIHAGPVTSASWRTKVLLTPGEYRFEGLVRTDSVEALSFGRNHGAMLRVTQVPAARPPPLLNTQPWSRLEVLFEISDREREVELVCELRGRAGTAWFDLESLRITRR